MFGFHCYLPSAQKVIVCMYLRFFACVQSHVCLKMMIAGEPFVTHLALKRFLSSMCPFMVLQYMFVTKRSVTNLACEDFISAVLMRGN